MILIFYTINYIKIEKNDAIDIDIRGFEGIIILEYKQIGDKHARNQL